MRYWVPVIAGLAVVCTALSPSKGQDGPNDEIILGSTCAVTGQLAATGLTVFHALEMAVEDVNAAGGVNGKRLRLVNEDAGSSNSSAVTAYIKLVQQHKPPFVFISSYSPQILAQSSEVARAEIGAMHAGGAQEIDELQNPWLFRIKPSDVVNTKAVASVVLDDLKKSRPGLIYVQNDYGQGFARQLDALFTARGVTLIKESYGPTDNDMSAQLQRLVSQGVDVLLTAGFNRDSALILRARKALGITLPVVGQQALGVSATTDLLEPSELDGVYALADAMLDERKSFDKASFLRRYEERHNLKPDPSFITNYYDGVWIVAEAIRQVGEDPKRIRDFVANLKGFSGVTRDYSADSKGTMTNSVVIVRYDERKTQLPVRVFTDAPTTVTADRKEIVIGATVPMTGASASSGLLYYNALQMAEEDINRAGGINGVPVRIAIEDAQSSNSTAVNAFVKVAQEQRPAAVLISSFTPQNFAVEPEVRRAAIPTFYAGGADGLHRLGNPWMFRIKQPDSVVAEAMSDVALNDLRARRPAVLFAQNDYGQGMADEMRNLFRAAGLDPIVESYPLDENDFGTHLLSIANQGADALMSVGYVRDTALMLGARGSLGLKFPVVTNPSLALPSALSLVSGEDVDGAYTVMDAYLPARAAFDPSNFLGRYLDRYKVGADPSFVTNYYDTAMMLADAMRTVGTAPDALRAYFATLKDRPGITRTYTTDSAGNLGRSAAIVKFTPGTKDFTFVRNFEVTSQTSAPTTQQTKPTSSAVSESPASQRPSPITAFLQTLFNGLAIGCIYALLALGFVLIYEATGVVNFAAGQFVVVGAFLGISIISTVGAVLPGTALALVAMVALGVLFFFSVYRPLQRSPVVTVIVGTIAVGIIVQNICLLVWGPLPQRLPTPFGTSPVTLGGVVISAHILAVIAITIVVVAGLYTLLYRTVLGARMRAVAQDAETAKLMGINVAGIYALTWALAGGLAGLGGLLMGPVWFVDSSMGDALALKSFASTIIGGFGSVPGAIAGGVIVGLAESLGAAYVSSTYKDALVFLLMVGFLLMRPQGIFGEFGGDRG